MESTNSSADHGEEKLSGMETKAASSSSSTNSGISRRALRSCARCSNHRLKIALKGHKHYCKYRFCNCKDCKLTAERQKVMAKQTARRRALALDEMRGRAPDEQVDPPPFPMDGDRLTSVSQSARSFEGSYDSSSGDSPISNHGSNGLHNNITGVISIPPARKLPPLHTHTASPTHPPPPSTVDSVEVLLEYSAKLLELFQYPWDMVPLMYVILKDAGANLEEAMRRIVEANNDIRALHFWKAVRRTYCCTGYTTSLGSVGAPTYEGQVPYIGIPPTLPAVNLRPFPHTLNAHLPGTRVPTRPDSPPEHPAT